MCWIQAEADRRHSHHCATKEEEEEAFHGVYLISGTPTMMDGARLCIIIFFGTARPPRQMQCIFVL